MSQISPCHSRPETQKLFCRLGHTPRAFAFVFNTFYEKGQMAAVSLFDIAEQRFGSNFLFDDATRTKFLCEIAKQSIVDGDLSYLQSNSPATKQLREFIVLAQRTTGGQGQQQLIDSMVQQYLTQKQSEQKLPRRALVFSDEDTKPPAAVASVNGALHVQLVEGGRHSSRHFYIYFQ